MMKGQQHTRSMAPRRDPRRARRRWRDSLVGWLALAATVTVVGVLIALGLTYWHAETEYSDQQRVCIAQRFKQFDPKTLSQCVDACKACMSGSTATCTTSCKLKGAT
jgi:hypothetical protein